MATMKYNSFRKKHIMGQFSKWALSLHYRIGYFDWSSPAFTEGRSSSVKEQNHEGVNILYSGRIVIVVSELLLQGVEGGFCNRFYWCPIFLPHSSSVTSATAMVALCTWWLPTLSTYYVSQLFAAWSMRIVSIPRVSLQPMSLEITS